MEQNTQTAGTGQTAPQLPAINIVVRYGYIGLIGEFEYTGDRVLVPNQAVIIETERGIELGHFLCYSSETKSGLKVCPKQIARYLDQSGSEYLTRKAGKIVRPADPQDLIEQQHIRADSIEKKQFCSMLAERYNLKMKIVCVEHLFGGERIIFYFISEGRIDFRELVRELAKEYQTRIELRQIGARDEARLLADYEICGRQCCCKNFLKTLHPVNMKMAKLQKATLDPSKVSGRCGRLRCCLRYEQRTYEELVSSLPAVGTWVRTPNGVGRVKDRMVLTQLVQVAFEDNRFVTFPIEELSPATPPNGKQIIEQKETESEEEPDPDLAELDDNGIGDLIEKKESNSKPQNDQDRGESRRPRRNRGKKRRR